MLLFSLFCVLAFGKNVLGAWPQAFDSGFLSWRWQTCVVVGNWLYIDGGEYYSDDGNGYFSITEWNETLSFDLSRSWKVGDVEPSLALKPSNMMLVRRPVMWYDEVTTTVFSGSGWSYANSDSYSMWSFQPDGSGSANWHISGSSNIQQYTPTFASAFTASNTSLFSLGGVSVNLFNDTGIVNTTISGLAVFDFEASTWNTQSSIEASQSGNSVFAEAVFVQNFGEQGLVVVLGGESPPTSSYEYETGAALVQMSNITIYDPTTQQWYHQTATGDIPPPRLEYCAVGNAPTDNATYEIFIFGGSTNQTFDQDHPNEAGYTDVYVLSLPAFTWFKTSTTSSPRRSNHYCQIIGNSQMLVVGGANPSNGNYGGFGGDADPWKRGMKIFDMSNWAWTSAYDHTSVYTRPKTIQQYYDDPTTANSTNWSDPTLASLFTAKSKSSNASAATATATSSSTPTSHTSSTGAIVGGVVGGIAAIAAILGLTMFCLARRRKQRQAGAYAMPSNQYSDREGPYEMPLSSRKHEKRFHELDDHSVGMSTPPVELPAGER